MTISQSRRNQIESQLANLGVTASDEAVNGVVDILKADQRATVASACRRYAQSVNPQSVTSPIGETATGETEPQSNVIGNGNSVKDALKKTLKQKIVKEAWTEVVNELRSGDFSDVEIDAIDIDFDEVFDNINFFNPSVALPPASNQRSLPSSEEIFDHAVVGNITQS
jgi:hypothetical protein